MNSYYSVNRYQYLIRREDHSIAQKERMKALLAEAGIIMMTGVEFMKHDLHIWESLATTAADIIYVNPAKNSIDTFRHILIEKVRLICISGKM